MPLACPCWVMIFWHRACPLKSYKQIHCERDLWQAAAQLNGCDVCFGTSLETREKKNATKLLLEQLLAGLTSYCCLSFAVWLSHTEISMNNDNFWVAQKSNWQDEIWIKTDFLRTLMKNLFFLPKLVHPTEVLDLEGITNPNKFGDSCFPTGNIFLFQSNKIVVQRFIKKTTPPIICNVVFIRKTVTRENATRDQEHACVPVPHQCEKISSLDVVKVVTRVNVVVRHVDTDVCASKTGAGLYRQEAKAKDPTWRVRALLVPLNIFLLERSGWYLLIDPGVSWTIDAKIFFTQFRCRILTARWKGKRFILGCWVYAIWKKIKLTLIWSIGTFRNKTPRHALFAPRTLLCPFYICKIILPQGPPTDSTFFLETFWIRAVKQTMWHAPAKGYGE